MPTQLPPPLGIEDLIGQLSYIEQKLIRLRREIDEQPIHDDVAPQALLPLWQAFNRVQGYLTNSNPKHFIGYAITDWEKAMALATKRAKRLAEEVD